MNRTKTKRRPSRLLALCLSLTVALGLLTVPVAAVDYQEGIDEYYEGHSTQQFGNNHLIFNVPVRYYDTAAGENVYSNTLQVSGVLMMDGLEEVAVTCGGVSRTVSASSGQKFSLELTLTHSGTAAAEVATRRSGETAFRNVTHGQYLYQRMPNGGYDLALSIREYERGSNGAYIAQNRNSPTPENQLLQPVPAAVAAMSAQIVGDETDRYAKMFLLYKWVTDNIAHDTAMESGAAEAVTDSESVLTLRRTNSTGYANLLRDLILAQGIPAITCETEYLTSGSYATAGATGVPHSHAEAYLDNGNPSIFGGERWVFMDPATDSLNTYTGGVLHTESANGYNTFDLYGMSVDLSYHYLDRSGLTHIDNGEGFILGGANFTEVWDYYGPGGEVTIPDGVTRINEGAFAGRPDITVVHFQEGLERIQDGAFRGCTGLTEISFPSSLEYVGSYAFAGCTGLERVDLSTLRTSNATIQTYAFAGCTSLRSIYIPDMHKFASYAFAGSGIRVLQFADDYTLSTYTNGQYAFSGIPYLTAVELPGSGTFDRISYRSFNEEGRVLDEPLQIYYKGTGEERENLVIDSGNELLWEGRWHYNSGIPEDMMARILSEELPPVTGLSLLPGYPTVSDWAQGTVEEAAELLQLAEVPFLQDTFDYTEDITRADFAALAVQTYEALTGDEVAYAPGDAVFADSTGDVAIAKAYNLGIMGGYNSADNRAEIQVGPNDLITREQAAAMLARLNEVLGQPLAAAERLPFTDPISDWAQDGVSRSYQAGIMTGTGADTFGAAENYTIEQAIVTMYRTYQF